MTPSVVFDTHSYVKALNAAGISEKQAEVQSDALAKALQEFRETHLAQLATRQDLRELELRLKHDLTLRLGGMLVVAVSVVAALVKIL